MGKKYIIEIPEDKIEDFVGNTHFLMPYMMAGHIGHHDTGLPIEPYTEPDLEQVRKEAYEHGYYIGYSKYLNRSYEDGLKDAWEAARKIDHMSDEDIKNVFGCGFSAVFETIGASEAIEKIRQYEQEQKEIKVGDEVKTEDGQKMVIAAIVNKDFAGLADDGRFMYGTLDETITRTGRHFPEIASVLQKMRGEQ